MFVKVKSPVFIDALQIELSGPKEKHVLAILKDDKGSVCSSIEKDICAENEQFTWTGLNDLPYGTYTLELSQGYEPERFPLKMNVVKRV